MYGPNVARELPGPDWLRALRVGAAERLDGATLPTTDEEVWRYSRIAELDLEMYAPTTARPGDEVPAEARHVVSAIPDRAGLVVVRDGFVVQVDLDQRLAAAGLWAGPLADAPGGEELLGSVDDRPHDVFGGMNLAYAPEPLLVRVPQGLVVEHPIVIVDWADTEGLAVFPRTLVQLAATSSATIVEWQGGDASAFVAPVTEIDVAPEARLTHVNVQQRGPSVWQIAEQTTRVDQQALFVGHQTGLGGDYARSRVDCRLVGRGATGNLRAAYFGEGEQMLDFRTFQDHLAPDTTSDLLFKGAVSGTSRSVYTGLIHVGKDARGTNAFQTNRNVKLSDGAWAESVPNLEIENNDVRCSHASTVGPIDEDQRFYLESRGVPPSAAERLIVAGFFDEVVGQIPVPPLVERLEAEVDHRLAAGSA
jgi:Fe-S cluster assembly protein SufD